MEWSFWFWILMYLCVIGSAVGAALVGKENGNSFFDKMYGVLYVYFPKYLKQGLRMIFGERAVHAVNFAWDYVVWQNNPLVQIFYAFVVGGAYCCYCACIYPIMPNLYVAGWHRHAGFVLMLFCLFSWLMCSIKDPGIITEWNVDAIIKHYGFTSPIFEKADCRTCKTVKPSRSKHCSLCDICVARFDHHCIWINNCVGIGNHRWFLWFLISHTAICVYGAVIGAMNIMYITKSKGLFSASAQFVDPHTQEKMSPSIFVVFQYLMATDSSVMILTFICVIMSVLSGGFFMWHLYLAMSNCTGNEIQKWKFLKYCFEYEGTLDENRDKLENVYDRGSWLKNLKEIFCPIDVNNLETFAPSKIDPIMKESHGKPNKKGGAVAGSKKKKGKA